MVTDAINQNLAEGVIGVERGPSTIVSCYKGKIRKRYNSGNS